MSSCALNLHLNLLRKLFKLREMSAYMLFYFFLLRQKVNMYNFKIFISEEYLGILKSSLGCTLSFIFLIKTTDLFP